MKVSILLKIISLKYEKNFPRAKSINNKIKFFLIDCRPRAENQIVSNIYSSFIKSQNNCLLQKVIKNI